MVGYVCLALVINSLHNVINFKDMFYGVAFGNEKVVVLHETRWKSDAVLMIMAFEMVHIQEHPHSKLGPLHHSLSCTITLRKHCVTLLLSSLVSLYLNSYSEPAAACEVECPGTHCLGVGATLWVPITTGWHSWWSVETSRSGRKPHVIAQKHHAMLQILKHYPCGVNLCVEWGGTEDSCFYEGKFKHKCKPTNLKRPMKMGRRWRNSRDAEVKAACA